MELVSGNMASESVAPSFRESQTLRYESLTVWRGVACLLIVVYHSILYRRVSGQSFVFGVLNQFWIGVPVFFVISGYCITASAEALRRKPVPVRRFFWRRIHRIFPPYWAWFGIMAVAVYLVETFIAPGYFRRASVPPLEEMTKWRWLGNVSLMEMWRTHLTGESPTKLFWGPSWTLCYEEQFYLVVGLILLFARRWIFRAATLISLGVLAGAVFISGYDQKSYGTFFNCLWLTFAAGVLAYYALNNVGPERRNWYCIPLIAGAAYLVADPRQESYLDGKWVMGLCGIAAFYVWKYSARRWRYLFFAPLVAGSGFAFMVRASSFRGRPPDTGDHCVMAFLFAFLIIALKKWDDSINRSRVFAPIRFCGEMCYSLYLVHWPTVLLIGHTFDLLGITSPAAILFVTVPVCVAVTLLIAWVFHRLVERRFWNRRI